MPRNLHLVIATLFASCLFVPGARAQDHLAPAAVADLATAVHLPREAFIRRLAEIAPDLRPRPTVAIGTDGDDPFLWRFEAAFGAPRAPREPFRDVPAGLIHCARFGLATRDHLAAHAASDPVVFPLVTALRVETRDIEAWPPEAIAVLRCSFAWDDARRIAPWDEAQAEPVFTALFTDIRRRDDATVRAEAGDHIGQQYGPGGFRLDGRDAEPGVYYWLEGLTVARQLSHQRVAFRVYLLSGGV